MFDLAVYIIESAASNARLNTSLQAYAVYDIMKALFWLSVLSQLLETNAEAQKVIACPEQLGGAPQVCVSEECGKEDSANKGHCANKAVDKSQCLCMPSRCTWASSPK